MWLFRPVSVFIPYRGLGLWICTVTCMRLLFCHRIPFMWPHPFHDDCVPIKKTQDFWAPTQEIPYWSINYYYWLKKRTNLRQNYMPWLAVQMLLIHPSFQAINFLIWFFYLRLQISHPVLKRHFYSSTKPTQSKRFALLNLTLKKMLRCT